MPRAFQNSTKYGKAGQHGKYPITGTQSVNYYNEPIAIRLGASTDLPTRSTTRLRRLEIRTSIRSSDTLMRAYQGDNVQVRVLVGAHVFAHQFNLAGPTWLAERREESGYRSSQPMGLSEHFELLFKVPQHLHTSSRVVRACGSKCPDGMSTANCVDYFYSRALTKTVSPRVVGHLPLI